MTKKQRKRAPAPKVFVSYSRDSKHHEQYVLQLAQRLREDGIKTSLDQYVSGTAKQKWDRWMSDQIDWADFVICVCTHTYYRGFRGHRGGNKGKGADWEGALISQEIYEAKSATVKFVAVFFDASDKIFIPEPLLGHTYYLLDSEENYSKLYQFLTGQAGVIPRRLGPIKKVRSKPISPLRWAAPLNVEDRRTTSISRARKGSEPATQFKVCHSLSNKGNLRIKTEAVQATFSGQFQMTDVKRFRPPFAAIDIEGEILSEARVIPHDVESLRLTHGQSELQKLKEEGRISDNNQRYDLVSLNWKRNQDTESGHRVPKIVLGFEPCDYLDYVSGGGALDKKLLPTATGGLESIRQRYHSVLASLSWHDIGRLPVRCVFATVLGAVTADKYFVIPVRSEYCAVGSELKAIERGAMSCAEGMLRPTDTTHGGRFPSPFRTAARALKEELGLQSGEHFDESDICLLALSLDEIRAQPLAVFFVNLKGANFEQVARSWLDAKDKMENKALVGVPINGSAFAQLFHGCVWLDDRPLVLFSNHQRFGFWQVADFLGLAQDLDKYRPALRSEPR